MSAQTAAAAASINKLGRIGFVGGGQMATALVRGLIECKVLPAHDIYVSDLNPAQLTPLSSLGARTFNESRTLASSCNILILCVKPNIIPIVLRDLSSLLNDQHLIISIAAGVTIASITECLSNGSAEAKRPRVARVMPNTPALVGAGASGFALGGTATKVDAAVVNTIFGSIGIVHELPEKNIDAVTGVSGSGPAYVFAFIEALADGGVRAGLARDVAQSLAIQTVLGSAKLAQSSGRHPGQLKDSVASPGGTTIYAIHALEKGGFRATVMDAVIAAADRATAMSKL